MFFQGFWPCSQASWSVLGRLGSVLGASWSVLGASWAVLGSSWWPSKSSWTSRCALKASKTQNLEKTTVFARFSYRRLRGPARPEQGPDAEGCRRRHGKEDLGGSAPGPCGPAACSARVVHLSVEVKSSVCRVLQSSLNPPKSSQPWRLRQPSAAGPVWFSLGSRNRL